MQNCDVCNECFTYDERLQHKHKERSSKITIVKFTNNYEKIYKNQSLTIYKNMDAKQLEEYIIQKFNIQKNCKIKFICNGKILENNDSILNKLLFCVITPY